MRFLSVCSGIEAASVAWNPLGWEAVAFSEIEPFPCAVLAHHYPDVPNMGDMSKFREWPDELFAEADAIVGGPPCQAFSVAGLRNGLNDDRGNLTLTYAEMINHADAIRSLHGKPPVIVLYENVPGLLSDKTGAYGCFLAALAGEAVALEPPGSRWTDAGCVFGPKRAIAWRVLDAQYFALAQRRRRVFVVASARDGFDPATVLFEWDGVRRDSAPRREAGEGAAGGAGSGSEKRSWPAEISSTLDTTFGTKQGLEDQHVNAGCPLFVPGTTHTLRGEGFDASEDRTGRGTPLVPVNVCPTLRAGGNRTGGDRPPGTDVDTADSLIPVAFSCKDYGADAGEVAPTLRSMGHDKSHANAGGQVAIAFNARQDPDHWHDRTGPLDTDGGTQAVSYAIQAGALRTNPASGPDGVGVQADHAYTLEARAEVQAVAVRDVAQTVTSNYGKQCDNSDTALGPNVAIHSMQVRRLTPTEAERLMGFPDDYTAIPWRGKPADQCPDGPRYKALGNSWAVPVVRWIGERIQQAVDPT